ncbi:MAG: hypothetical protein ACREGG_01815 [Candidatus Saccharimonadales bacterium]
MKRLWLYLGGAVLVAGAAVAIVVAADSSKSQDENISSQSNTTPGGQQPQSVKRACNVFTLADAKKLLGDNAKGGQTSDSSSSIDLAVSACTYTADAGSNAPVSSGKSATLLVRAPKTEQGETSNQDQFGPLKPTSVTDVSGYGDKAYWDPQYGQLNILKNDDWYILSYGPITPTSRTLQQTEQLANILINKM